MPNGQNHRWIEHYDYRLSDYLPAAPAKPENTPGKTVAPAAQKKAGAALPAGDGDEEMQLLAAAELDAEAAHYAARYEAEANGAEAPAGPVQTYDNPFDEPAPTATDKHNTSVKNALRAKRAAAAKNSRLTVAGNVLTKSQPV